jgi:hypothetical protein
MGYAAEAPESRPLNYSQLPGNMCWAHFAGVGGPAVSGSCQQGSGAHGSKGGLSSAFHLLDVAPQAFQFVGHVAEL